MHTLKKQNVKCLGGRHTSPKRDPGKLIKLSYINEKMLKTNFTLNFFYKNPFSTLSNKINEYF